MGLATIDRQRRRRFGLLGALFTLAGLTATLVVVDTVTAPAAAAELVPGACVVAGGNGPGPDLDQLRNPSGVFVDDSGNVYVSDEGNGRVVRWAPGASEGAVVAGGNPGPGSAEFHQPAGISVDGAGNVFVADSVNNRIVRWAASASDGVIVAGGGLPGAGLSQLDFPLGVAVDSAGSVFVADTSNNRVVRWDPLAAEGVVVAGGNGSGSDTDQLNGPAAVFIDVHGSMYVADSANHRIMRWAPGATEGLVVAGGSYGPGLDQLSFPTGVFVNDVGEIYIADRENHRVVMWRLGETEGVIVGEGFGSGVDELSAPSDVFLDSAGNVYVSDTFNHRVVAFGPVCGEAVTAVPNVSVSPSVISECDLPVTVNVTVSDMTPTTGVHVGFIGGPRPMTGDLIIDGPAVTTAVVPVYLDESVASNEYVLDLIWIVEPVDATTNQLFNFGTHFDYVRTIGVEPCTDVDPEILSREHCPVNHSGIIYTGAVDIVDGGNLDLDCDSVPDADDPVCDAPPVVCFAPVLTFHPDEPVYLMDPAVFIAESELKWYKVGSGDDSCEIYDFGLTSEVVDSNPDPSTIAEYQRDITCDGLSTAVWSSIPEARPFSPYDDHGFALDFDESSPSAGGRSPDDRGWGPSIFAEVQDDRILYWWFFPDDPKASLVGDLLFSHEGDWEGIEIVFDDGQPLHVAYRAHNCDDEVRRWGDPNLELIDGWHPRVYAAKGTHASSPDVDSPSVWERFGSCPGGKRFEGTTDSTADGRDQLSWLGMRNAAAEPWYDFGGAWGNIGDSDAATGPHGPKWKRGVGAVGSEAAWATTGVTSRPRVAGTDYSVSVVSGGVQDEAAGVPVIAADLFDDLELALDVQCADGSEPTAVTAQLGSFSGALDQDAATGEWDIAISPADVEPGDLELDLSCTGGDESLTVAAIELFDPSGVITDQRTSEPISGASVELFMVPGWQPGGGGDAASECQTGGAPWTQSAPTELGVSVSTTGAEVDGGNELIEPDINPQRTSADGRYGWNVAQGCWYIVVSAEGYVTQTSSVVGVPPEVTDLHIALEPIESCAPSAFVDVVADEYYEDAVAWAACNGITTGTSASTFSPDAPVTRAQMATFLWRYAGKPTGAPAHGFSDVLSADYFDAPVSWLKESGITKGTSTSTFSPGDTVTRAQMAAFIWRFMDEPVAAPHSFVDVPDTAYFDKAVAWMSEAEITTGTSLTTYSPARPLSRGQAVTFLWRLAGRP